MLDRSQLKTEGLHFARSLQLVFKTVAMFSSSHATAQGPLQNSFNLLNELVKGTRQFTIGFVDKRVLLNNVLTTEKTLQALEAEFQKRGISAVTFESGITFAAYTKLITLLCAQPREIAAQGGILSYLQANPIEFARVFPTQEEKSKKEDTILDVDSESYLMAKAMSEVRPEGSVDWFMQKTGLSGGGGSATGEEVGTTSAGGGPAPRGNSTGSAEGEGASGGVDGDPILSDGPTSIESVVQNYFNGALMDPSDTQARALTELLRIVRDARPEILLRNFPPHRREELRKLPPDQLAQEVVEESAAKWAIDRLANVPPGGDEAAVEDDVTRVLLRVLQSAQAANRMIAKLTEEMRRMQMSPTAFARLQEELQWVALPVRERLRRLMEIQHYSRPEFRRLIAFMGELAKAGDHESMYALATHYFEILDAPRLPEPEELGRAPELLNAASGLKVKFWQETASRVCKGIERSVEQPFHHQQLVNAMVAVCSGLGLHEDFVLIESVGKVLEGLATTQPERHSQCCGATLSKLLPQNSVERVIESYMQRKDDHAMTRTVTSLLRRSGNPGVEKAFQRLENESSTPARLSLLRLIGRMGNVSIELALERLGDPRWYVVRNACKLLGELKDPDLPAHIAPALRHQDERVQKAAVSAIIDSRNPKRAGVLAENLSDLPPEIVEHVLTELTFLRDPVCIPALEKLIFSDTQNKTRIMCVQVLTSIGGVDAEMILLRVLASTMLDVMVRRAAMNPLLHSKLEPIQHALSTFTLRTDHDPVREETRQALYAAGKI